MNEQHCLNTPLAEGDAPLTIQTDKRKTLGWSALALAFVAVFGTLSLTAGRTESPSGEASFIVATLFCLVLVVVFGIPRLVTTHPALIVSHDGLRLGQSRLGLDLIPWSQITALTMIRVYGQAVLEIQVAHPEALLSGVSERQRLLCLARYPQLSSAGILTLSGSMFATPLGKVLVQIKRRFGAELEEYGIQVTLRR